MPGPAELTGAMRIGGGGSTLSQGEQGVPRHAPSFASTLISQLPRLGGFLLLDAVRVPGTT